jgi:hypothetical protein
MVKVRRIVSAARRMISYHDTQQHIDRIARTARKGVLAGI